ncbi:MAG: paraquat-inducible protein B [Nitrospirales bacterium]|nr:MAG: paraquat-inducible protein B [Nitrospirales bacterium]
MSTNFPVVSKIRLFSPVWIVPVLALLIAGWLAFNAWQEIGPTIEIVFDSAASMAVGKTHLRYRDVDVGKVTNIKLNETFEKVTVFVELDPHIVPLISVNTRFWVVSPRISSSGVSGLDTLLSGVYIEMAPGDPGDGTFRFEGLSQPPVVGSYEKGNHYVLTSESLGSLDIGSPVYHRQIPVGEVTGYTFLPEEERHVHIQVFVKSPYDKLVTTRSQFWNISGIDVNIGADGIEAKVAPLTSVIAGGVAFHSPPSNGTDVGLAEQGQQFQLFESKEAIVEGAIMTSYDYLLRFAGSVRGLRVGAPVELRGLQVGQVTHVGLGFMLDENRTTNVVIGIQPERWTSDDLPTQEHLNNIFSRLVAEGLQAQLQSGNLVTGAMFVDLVPNATKRMSPLQVKKLVRDRGYVELPTGDSEFTQLTNQLSDTVEKIQAIPFESIGHNVDESLISLRNIVATLEHSNVAGNIGEVALNLKAATEGLDATVRQLEQTLRSVDQTITPDSELNHNMNKMVRNISDAAKSMEELTDELNRYPNAVLRGREDND